MKVIFLEDEALAAERLEQLVLNYDSTIEILTVLDSVETAVSWLESNDHPDLAFFDIQLADGLSFEVFEKCAPDCPVIFTTAFDAYALRAFKVNSIDYLLKPIDQEELDAAIDRFQAQQQSELPSALPDLRIIQQTMQMITKQYKSRFMIKSGSRLFAIPVEEIDFFFSENKITWLRRRDGKKYQIDYRLEQLDELLDPQQFFRLNRKYITAFPAIEQVTTYSNSRLKVQLIGIDGSEDVLISRERVANFKAWMDQ